MKKIIIVLLILTVLVSGCEERKVDKCFREIATEYCESVNESYNKLGEIMTKYDFTCIDETRTQQEYKFTYDERQSCYNE